MKPNYQTDFNFFYKEPKKKLSLSSRFGLMLCMMMPIVSVSIGYKMVSTNMFQAAPANHVSKEKMITMMAKNDIHKVTFTAAKNGYTYNAQMIMDNGNSLNALVSNAFIKTGKNPGHFSFEKLNDGRESFILKTEGSQEMNEYALNEFTQSLQNLHQLYSSQISPK